MPAGAVREGHCAVAGGGGEDYRRIGQDELGEHLAAGAAGRARGVVQIGDATASTRISGPNWETARTKAERSAQMSARSSHSPHSPGDDFAAGQPQRAPRESRSRARKRAARPGAPSQASLKARFPSRMDRSLVLDFSKAWK